MKKLKKLKTIEEIVSVLEALERAFTLTDFTAVKALLKGITPYSYDVDLELYEEGNYGSKAFQKLEIYHEMNMSPRENTGSQLTEVYFEWVTGSDHKVKIKGTTVEGFDVYIGTDESNYFYPTVTEVIKAITFIHR